MEDSFTYRNVKIGGFSDSVLKSAIQKYLRRKEIDKGFASLKLLLSISKYMDKDPKRIKSILSNTINRLIVMMSEDVGIAEPSIVMKVHYFYEKYLDTHDLGYILTMYNILIHSKKTRFISDIKSVFLLPFMDDKDISNEQIKHHNDLINLYIKGIQIVDFDENTAKEEFTIGLHTKNLNQTFLALGSLLRKNSNLRKERCRNVWKILNDISNNESMKMLHFFYKKMTHREKTIYLYHAILLHLFDIKTNNISSYEEKMNFDSVKIPNNLQLDYYVFDKHTLHHQKTNYHFALEGSWIFEEIIFNPIYRLIYRRKKQLQDYKLPCFIDHMNIHIQQKFDSLFDNSKEFMMKDIINTMKIENISKEEWENILKLPHGQKRCGKHKKTVYISDSFTFKGIYFKDEHTFKTALFYQDILEQIQGLHKIDTVIPIVLITCQDHFSGQFFIKSKNIGEPINFKDVEIVSTKIEENVPILKRCSYVFRASDIIDKLDTFQKKNCLYHLYLRYLLNIGDSGLHNILIGKNGEVVGIDFEEQRGSIKIECAMDALFSRKISKSHYEYLKDSLYWTDWIEDELLKSLKIQEDLKKMIIYRNRFLKCLLQFGCV